MQTQAPRAILKIFKPVRPETEVPTVRDAGPENMANPPRRWDKTDEALDESFPASDPSH
jgi:hypothetical protein